MLSARWSHKNAQKVLVDVSVLKPPEDITTALSPADEICHTYKVHPIPKILHFPF